MMTKTLTSKRVWLPVLVAGIVVLLASWDYQQKPVEYKNDQQPTDTIPKKKKAVSDKKVRDLDEAIEELENAEFKIDMEKIKKEIEQAMKSVDMEKIKLEVENAMNKVKELFG